MRQVLCPVLIGRQAEFDLLRSVLDLAADGTGGTAFVSGEAGVGKSRLVREVASVAASRGWPVLVGRAVAGGVPVAFRPLAEAVLGGLRGRGEFGAPELQPFRAALGRLVPEWLPREPVPGAESPVVLAEGLLRLLRVLGGRGACLLVVEDLHWADPESLTVLEYLADNVSGQGVVCLGTVRTGEESGGRHLVDTLAGRRAARVVELRRFDDEATVRFARACLQTRHALPAEVEAYLRAYADGVPFLVEELLAGLVAGGVLAERDGRWSTTGPIAGRVPPTFAEAVRRRVDSLPHDARGVLRAAAVLGRQFDWTLLPAATGRSDAEVASALRHATDTQLLAVRGDGFRFRHALTRDAVLADLVAPERFALAAKALAAVERAAPEQYELAAELAEAAGDGPRAAALLLEAGRRATAAGALATAEAALLHARNLAPDDLVVPVDDALTEVYALAGQVDRVFEVGERLSGRLDLASRLPSGRAELHLRLARAAVAAGRWVLAEKHLASARGAAGPGAGIDALAAQVALGRGELDRADNLATAALSVAEEAGLPALACEALEVSGRVARQRDLDAAETAFTRGLRVATAHGLELWRLRALHELGTVDQLRTESVDRLRQARELAGEAGALALVATLDLQIAAGLIKQFRPDEGLAAARASADASRRLRLATLPMALVLGAAAHAQRGRGDDMEAALTDACALAPDDLDVRGSAWGHCRATLSLLREDRARALEEMTTGARLLERSPATVAPPFLGLRVLLLAVSGDDSAASEAQRVRGSAASRHRIVASLVGCAEAVLLGRAGHRASAAYAAADAEMGPLVAWYRQYARRLVAEAAQADGWGEPVGWLREAAGYFAGRGDTTIAAACRSLLRRAGVPVPRANRGDPVVPAGLRALGVTDREADVLALVAEGLTNRELAARLYLSPRTVEKHVANLLAKTGCRRRAELAGYSEQLPG